MLFASATNTLADRFAWLIDGLCNAIGRDARRHGLNAALAWAIWNRVRVLGDRLIALGERVRVGRLRVRRERAQGGPRGSAESRAAAPRMAGVPAEDFGWVKRLLPETG